MCVLGGGPAGTALATALAARGITVILVDRHPDRPWPNRYGAWLDELGALGLEVAVSQSWARSELVLPDGEALPVSRAYASVNGAALRDALVGRGPVSRRAGAVEHLEPLQHGHRVHLTGEPPLSAAIVVDATGHQSPFVQRTGPPASAWQIAYGVDYVLEQPPPYAADAMRFMDWRGVVNGGPPTFLYAMPVDATHWFFEETLLIGAPMSFDQLERRLAARLVADGIVGQPLADVERCRFPMDPPLPVLDQPVLGFGAAASLVHPATGYMLMRTLRAADPVAESIAEGLRAGHPPRDVVRDAWHTLWPPALLDTARLLQFGARTLLTMDRAALGKFYRAFFSLPEPSWRGYLAGDILPGTLAQIMLQVFAACGMDLRLRLAAHGLRDPAPLVRGVSHMLRQRVRGS